MLRPTASSLGRAYYGLSSTNYRLRLNSKMSGNESRLQSDSKVKFIYQELPEDGAFITAQIAGNESRLFDYLDRCKKPP
jgi:hypothetical protein